MFCPLAMARCREPLGIGESRMERSGGGERSKRLTSALGALWLIWSALPHQAAGGRASRLSDEN